MEANSSYTVTRNYAVESYKVSDLTEYMRRHYWCNRVLGYSSESMVEKFSVVTLIATGGVTGCYVRFLFQKVGKLASTTVGGGFLLLQIAKYLISRGLVGGFLPGLAS
uniref:Uncharacterized protein n=1 Tax=Canis lupus familiaris TaxID=9615 RepID=A0A8P0TRN7_CANLF